MMRSVSLPVAPQLQPTATTRTITFNGTVGQLETRRVVEITGPGVLLYLLTSDRSYGNAGYSLFVDGASAILAGAQPFTPDVANPDIDLHNYFFPWVLAEMIAMVYGFPGRTSQVASNTTVVGEATYLHAAYDILSQTYSGTVQDQVMIYSAPIVWTNQLAVSVKEFGPAAPVFVTLTYLVGGVGLGVEVGVGEEEGD